MADAKKKVSAASPASAKQQASKESKTLVDEVEAKAIACEWTEIDFSTAACDVTDSTVVRLLRSAGKAAASIHRVRLSGCRNITSAALATIASGAPNLRRLLLDGCRPKRASLDKGILAISRLPKLAEFDISGCLIDSSTLATCFELLPRSLRVLKMNGIIKDRENKVVVNAIADKFVHLRGLTALHLSSCMASKRSLQQILYDVGQGLLSLHIAYTALRQRDLIRIVEYCEKLTDLNLYAVTEVDDVVLSELCETNPRIETLNIALCARVTDRGVRTVARRLTKLRELNLFNCSKITDRSIEYLAKRSATLEKLDIFGTRSVRSVVALAELLTKCPRLRHVTCGGGGVRKRDLEALQKKFTKVSIVF